MPRVVVTPPSSGGGSASLPADLTARLLPAAATPGLQLVSAASGQPTVGTWVAPPALSRYRGVWAAPELLATLDFASGAINPFVASGLGGTVAVAAMTTNGAASKPAWQNLLKLTTTVNTSGSSAVATIDSAALTSLLGGKQLTRMKWWDSISSPASTTNTVSEMVAGGVVQRSGTHVSGQTTAWAERDQPVTNPANLVWQIRNTSTSATGQTLSVAGIRLYGSTRPYAVGDTVIKDGIIYESQVNNNTNTPGADSAWVQV